MNPHLRQDASPAVPASLVMSVTVSLDAAVAVTVNVDVNVDENLHIFARAPAFDRVSVRGSWNDRESQLEFEPESQRRRGRDPELRS
jgi:hypothetical protein